MSSTYFVDGTTLIQASWLNDVNSYVYGGGTSVGPYLINSGSAAAPAYSFTLSPATGVYSPSVNSLAFATNGVSRMAIDSAGSVTIGQSVTASGPFITNVSGPGVQVKRTFDATQSNYIGGYNEDTTLAWSVGYGTNTNDLSLNNSKSGTLSLTTSGGGNLSLGNTGLMTLNGGRPIVGDTANGNWTIQASVGGWTIGTYFKGSSGTALGGFGAYGSGDSLTYLYIGDYVSPYVAVEPSGNVGIGGVSGGGRLEVTKNFAGDTYLLVRNTNTSGGTTLNLVSGPSTFGIQAYHAGGYVIESVGSGSLSIKYSDFDTHIFRNTAGTEKFRLGSAGQLGLSAGSSYGTSGQVAVSGGSGATASWSSTPRLSPRVGSTASSATPTINTDLYDVFKITALAVDITNMSTNLSGTPADCDGLIIQITGTAARAITWGTSFEASTIPLPTTTVSTDMLSVAFIRNTATSKWRCVGVA